MLYYNIIKVTICILTIPYAIERVALQWLSMVLAHAALDEDLQAARTVITSSSDAQGELDKDLRLLEVGSASYIILILHYIILYIFHSVI